MRFSTQALLISLAVLLVVVVSGLSLMALLLRRDLVAQYEQRALAIARSVAADPVYAQAVEAADPSHVIQPRAEAVRIRTGALFVVVTDSHGVRYSHPNPGNIGLPVSTDPSAALAGRDVVTMESGTLGLSARGKVPLRDANRVVGEVSVGIDAQSLNQRLFELVRTAALFMGIALALGAAGATWLSRRLKRLTLGLEPQDLANLLREQEAVVHGVQDGVLAVDPAGRVTVVNEAARQLLGVALAPGAHVAESALPARLREVLEGRRPVRGMLTTARERVLVVTTRDVVRHGRDLGTVATLRDRTDLDDMGRELEAVRALSDALRAQAHEYTNRLHTIAGLLQIGHADEARSYLRELSSDPLATESDAARLADPYLRGLLAAKTAAASERGVRLDLAPEGELRTPLDAPLDVVTVLGNLLDNATSAAARGDRRPAWVELALAADGADLLLAVTDSGDGVRDDIGERVFEEGVTTKQSDGQPHGIGLALARQVARRHGGDVELVRHSGPDHGAVFAARLPRVVQAVEPLVTP